MTFAMKVLVIPDVHLKPYMFHQADELLKQGVAERAVCLMDIPDDWGSENNIGLYVETFDAAIVFAKKYPDTLWAYGNHDLCYMWNERESGYSPMAAWTVQEKLLELRRALPVGHEIKYIQKIDNVLFCHGGVLDYFVKGTVPSSAYHDVDEVVSRINEFHHDFMWNDISPIWFRPQFSAGEMYKSSEILQVVGHTPVDTIYRKGNVISCDVFSTYRDGRPIGTGEFPVIDTETWEFGGISKEDGR